MTSTGRRPGTPSRPTGSAPASDAGRTHWFEPLADHVGAAYERYAFTKGTEQEVGALLALLDLPAGARVLDLGCGTGRHSRALAARGLDLIGLDVCARFLEVARSTEPTVPVVRGDARSLPLGGDSLDAVVSLCQGGFGLTGGPAAEHVDPGIEPDAVVLAEAERVLRPGGRVALTAFSAYFAVRDLGEGEDFDAAAGVLHEHTEVHDDQGRTRPQELWTTCYTPRELRLLLAHCGLAVEGLWSVQPGRYGQAPPTVDSPEYLAVAGKPR